MNSQKATPKAPAPQQISVTPALVEVDGSDLLRGETLVVTARATTSTWKDSPAKLVTLHSSRGSALKSAPDQCLAALHQDPAFGDHRIDLQVIPADQQQIGIQPGR